MSTTSIPQALVERRVELGRYIESAEADAHHFTTKASHWVRQATSARAELSGIEQAIAAYTAAAEAGYLSAMSEVELWLEADGLAKAADAGSIGRLVPRYDHQHEESARLAAE